MQTPETITFTPAIEASDEARSEFIRRTYFHLALAVLGFILVETFFLNTPAIIRLGLSMAQGTTWLLVLAGFMFVTSYAERWAMRSTDRTQQYLALALYVVAEAFIFVPLIFIAIAITGDLSLINQAAMLTASLFAGLTAVAYFSQRDYSRLRSFVMVGGMIALGLIAGGLLFGFTLGLWFSFAMVILAGASILYSTSRILRDYHTEQYVAASLGLFASLMLLFWYVLSILSRLSGD